MAGGSPLRRARDLRSLGSLVDLAELVKKKSKTKYRKAAAVAPATLQANPFERPVPGSFSLRDGHHVDAAGPSLDDVEDEVEFALRNLAGSRGFWDYALFALNLYLCLSIPFALSFGRASFSADTWRGWLAVNACVDTALVLDIAARIGHSLLLAMSWGAVAVEEVADVDELHLSAPRAHPLREFLGDPVAMHRPTFRYHRSWTLLADVLFLCPVDYVALAAGVAPSALAAWRVPRMLRVTRVAVFLYYSGGGSSALRRLTKATFWIVLVSHWLACIWLAASRSEGYVQRMGLAGESLTTLYRLAFYWAFTATIKAPTDVALDELWHLQSLEFAVATVSMVLGLVVFVVLVGEVSSLIALHDRGASAHRERLAATERFCARNRLPGTLRGRMLRHLEFTHARGSSEDSVLSSFSEAIRKDTVLFLCSDLVRRVPFFSHTEPGFLHSIVLLLQRQAASAGDVVVWEGELLTSIGFVGRGLLEESTGGDSAKSVLRTMSTGAYFGELALLVHMRRNSGSMRSPTSITALKFAELYTLSYVDVVRVMDSFPRVQRRLLEVAHSRALKRISQAVSAKEAQELAKVLESLSSASSPVAGGLSPAAAGGLSPVRLAPLDVPSPGPGSSASASASASTELHARIDALESKVMGELAELKEMVRGLALASGVGATDGGE